ncbi:uncharacterized protein L201_004713 [Kwoniella dendrophila CBS 6074]|uniref:Ubiquitin-like domain-containing protein n=1 Tax=Kwoniella dendrophila CBS 6074 TaxID=1295534 RepID=A0AAX4JYJ0_9TREE
MQTDPHHNHAVGDTSPLPPTSPTLSSTFRHHQPQHGHGTGTGTGAVEPSEASSSSSVRHRTPYTHMDDSNIDEDLVRISIQTPFGDLGGTRSRKKEGWPFNKNKTIEELKQDLINGKIHGAGTWEKDGMRVVYHGRIVRDNETLKDIIGKIEPEHVYVFHLVARRIPVTPLPTSGIMHQHLSEFPLPPQISSVHPAPFSPIPTTSSAYSSALTSLAVSTNSLALGDTIHYLLFTSRYHLFRLLGMKPLKWDNVVPHPTISQEKAREAIMSVIKVFAKEKESREEGWENWQRAFDGDSDEALKKMWEQLKRDRIMKEVKALWATAIGRNMSENEEKVQVEVDGTTYTLQLPPVSQLTPPQLTHLLLYLRVTALLPLIEPVYQQSLIPVPTPTATVNQIAPTAQTGQTATQTQNGRVVYRRTFHLRLPFIPMQVLPNLFWSSLKVTVMIWMLTRGMKWNDSRFWIMAGMAVGWWMITAVGEISRVTREIRTRTRNNAGNGNQAPEQAQTPDLNAVDANAQNINEGQGVPAGNANDNMPNQPAQPRPQAQNLNTLTNIRRTLATSWIPRFHLLTDSEQLRIPLATNLNGENILLSEPNRRNRPSRIQTQFILPILLWFITLIPEWENLRNRMIRRRERNMRIVVGENQRQNQSSTASTEQNPGEQSEQPSEEERLRQIESNLPAGLSERAKQYYLRIMDKGEGIDWEEEREAQRALGMNDNEENGNQEDDGMRLRML